MLSNKCLLSLQFLESRVYLFRFIHENHYEVLKLQRNCTAADIRKSFINLSKQCHPDKNPSDDSHSKFVRIIQAYKTLGNISLRREYDLGLSQPAGRQFYNVYQQGSQHTHNPWKDPSFYENRTKYDIHYGPNQYYGIKGIKKVSNSKIVIMCLGIMTLGIILQTFIIWKSFIYKQKDLDKKSIEAGKYLTSVRTLAAINGNDMQLERLEKICNRQNVD